MMSQAQVERLLANVEANQEDFHPEYVAGVLSTLRSILRVSTR